MRLLLAFGIILAICLTSFAGKGDGGVIIYENGGGIVTSGGKGKGDDVIIWGGQANSNGCNCWGW